MAEGSAYVPVSGGNGFNVQSIKVTQWIVDPTTGVGAWVDTVMQAMVVMDKRGDLIDNEDLLGEVLAELRSIRELIEELTLRLA